MTVLASDDVLRAPGAVIEIARTLREAGYETWCVGGAVRDALLGVSSLDWDLATAAPPKAVLRLFRRTVPVGIEFGTVGVLDAAGVMHEVTTFRRDVSTDGRHAVVEFGASLDDDLARRDFTINAIAFDPIVGKLHDPFGGRHDLSSRLVRAVGDAEARLEEDRLRALRAIRFASRFDFEIEAATWRAIVGSAPYLSRLSPERVKQEIEKTMDQVRLPSRALALWRDAGAFASLVPVLAAVSNDILLAVDRLPTPGLRGRPGRRSLRIAALFSNAGGVATTESLRALRFSNADVGWVTGLVNVWERFGRSLAAQLLATEPPTDAELRPLAAAIGRLRVSPFLRLAAARWSVLPTGVAPTPERVRTLFRQLARIAFNDAIEVSDLVIDGDDLRSVGIPAGPVYGRIFAAALSAVIADPSFNDRANLLAMAKTFVVTESEARGR